MKKKKKRRDFYGFCTYCMNRKRIFHELLEPIDSHFTKMITFYYEASKETFILQNARSWRIFCWITHSYTYTKNKRNYVGFRILIKTALLCQRKDSYTDSVYSKYTFGTILTILQRLNISSFLFTDPIFYRIDSPFWLYKNMWSSACLEARENVLLLILLPVFDTGSFIALLYLPYLLRVGYSSVRV